MMDSAWTVASKNADPISMPVVPHAYTVYMQPVSAWSTPTYSHITSVRHGKNKSPENSRCMDKHLPKNAK